MEEDDLKAGRPGAGQHEAPAVGLDERQPGHAPIVRGGRGVGVGVLPCLRGECKVHRAQRG